MTARITKVPPEAPFMVLLKNLVVLLYVGLLAFWGWLAETPVQAQTTGNGQKQPAAVEDRLFTARSLLRLRLPEDVKGPWTVADDRGVAARQGVFRQDERALYLGDLDRGLYFLTWGKESGPSSSGPGERGNRMSFLVLPREKDLPEDPFFVLNQPGLARAAYEGNNGAGSDYLFALDAMKRLGAKRLQTDFSREYAWDPQNPEERDWSALDALESGARRRGIRLLALLGGTDFAAKGAERPAEDPRIGADYIRDLMMRYGFQIDAFALWERPDDGVFAGSGKSFLAQVKPWRNMLKLRNPNCSISLGGLVLGGNDLVSPDRRDFLEALFNEGSDSFDILDCRADGPFEKARNRLLDLDKVLAGTPAAAKPRAVSDSSLNADDDGLQAQRRQAAETVKKLILYRFQNYRYFAAGPLMDGAGSPTTASLGNQALPYETAAGGTGFFSRGVPPYDRQPRLVAAAWVEALVRLAGSEPVEIMGFSNDRIEIYGFSRGGATTLAIWLPPQALEASGGNPVGAIVRWPEKADAEVFDLVGRRVTDQRLIKRNGENEFDVVVDGEPVYVVIQAENARVSW